MALAVVLVLIGLFIPATRSARRPARRIQCASILRQIGGGLRAYAQTYGALPPAYTTDANGKPLHSWRTLILPFIDASELYETIDLTKPWDDPVNAKAFKTTIGLFHCPETNAPPNTTTFLAVSGANCCFNPTKARRLAEIADGESATLMLIEVSDEHAVPWMAPVDASESLVLNLGSIKDQLHGGGFNACFVDGAVKFMNSTIDTEVLRKLMTIAGNDPLGSDDY